MNFQNFQNQNEERWREFESTLDRLDSGKATTEEKQRLPSLFRQVCSDFSLAQYRLYSATFCERLNKLVIRGYNYVHRERAGTFARMIRFLTTGLPRLVRSEWKLFWVCMVLFWGPGIAMVASSYYDMRWVESILGPEQMAHLEQGYGKGKDFSEVRDNFGSNFHMFGFYIMNNVGIDLRTFAGGILGGLGTLFFVIFNGVSMGAVTGYIIQACDGWNLLRWASGHATPELLGLILSGMAGLKIGFAMISPGRKTRKQALIDSGKIAVRLLFGAMILTSFAAVIEGFWSPIPFPSHLKYTFGAVMLASFTAYLLLAGRRRDTK